MSPSCALCLLALPWLSALPPQGWVPGQQTNAGSYPELTGPWAQVFGGSGADRIADAAPAPGGGVFVAGSTFSFGAGANDGWIARVGPEGETQWELALGGPGADELAALAATPDGGCIAVGFASASGAGATDGWVVKLAGDGSVHWQETLGTPGDGESFLTVSLADPAALSPVYYVGGWADTAANGRDAWVLKLDSGGSPLWQQRFGGKFDEGVSSIAASPEGALVVTNSNSPLGGPSVPFFRPWLIQLDGAGNALRQRTFNLSGGDALSDVVGLADGGFLLTGEILAMAFFRGDVWALRLDQDLEVVWDRRYGDNSGSLGVDAGQRVRVLPDGSFVIAGITVTAGAGSDDLWILNLNQDGQLRRNRTLGGVGFDGGGGLAVSSAGVVYAAGFAQAPGLGSLDGFLARITPGQQVFGAPACPATGSGSPNQWSSPLTIGTPTGAGVDTAVTPAPWTGVRTALGSGSFICP